MRIILIVLLALCGAAPLAAQPSAEAPQEVAERYFAAMRASDYRGAAVLMHPAALAQFRDFFQTLAAADSGDRALTAMFGVGSARELAALSPEDVFARVMSAVATLSPQIKEAMGSMRADIVGTVPEGADTVHVVYRMHMVVAGVGAGKLAVLSLRRSGTSWRALLTGDLEGMIQSGPHPR